MSAHEQFADDLALHALGVLQGEELAALERHLAECPACRRELQSLRGDTALLALSTSGPRPPARARQRLMDAVAREPRRKEAPATARWWTVLPAFAAMGLATLCLIFWMERVDLQHKLDALRVQFSQQQGELQQAREVVSTLTANDAMRVTLVAAKAPPQPQGKAIYLRDRSSLIFLASNMPQAPAGKAYELWLIPKSGAPIPAGVFKPDAHGSATVVNPPLPPGQEAKAFAITLEPEAGSSAPTSEVLMVGAGE
jgi:anti-sigma-K factor RskA